jgi:hypothetical protein
MNQAKGLADSAASSDRVRCVSRAARRAAIPQRCLSGPARICRHSRFGCFQTDRPVGAGVGFAKRSWAKVSLQIELLYLYPAWQLDRILPSSLR